MKDLIRSNAKLEKVFGAAVDYLVGGLTLAPARLSGHEVCNWRSAGCTTACNLWFSGRRVMPGARELAKRQTQWLFEDRPAFIAQLHRDIAGHVRKCEIAKLIPLIRLNVASDLDWLEVISRWPHVTFYDYTKSRQRFDAYLQGKLPANYHLTFSANENVSEFQLRSYLERGGNVAIVLDVEYHPQSGNIGTLPKTMDIDGKRFPVIDGDKHDVCLPEVDGRGVIRALRLKGTNAAKDRARSSTFAQGVSR